MNASTCTPRRPVRRQELASVTGLLSTPKYRPSRKAARRGLLDRKPNQSVGAGSSLNNPERFPIDGEEPNQWQRKLGVDTAVSLK